MKMIPFYFLLYILAGCALFKKAELVKYSDQNSLIESWTNSFCGQLEGKARLVAVKQKVTFDFSQRFDEEQVLFGVQTPNGEKVLILTPERWEGDFARDLIRFLMEQKITASDIRQLMLKSYTSFQFQLPLYLKPEQQCLQSFDQYRYVKQCRTYQLTINHEQLTLQANGIDVVIERDQQGHSKIRSVWSLDKPTFVQIEMTQNVSKCYKK
jgi:hypothetical protein